MIINGEIIAKLPEQSGVSQKGNQWRSQEYVIVEQGERNNNRICFRVNNDNVQRFACNVGDIVTATLGIDCREYNGKWYNEITCYWLQVTARRVAVQQEQPAQPAQDETPVQTEQQTGLPF